MPVSFPIILGLDASGIVVKVGANIIKYKPGDEVYTSYHSQLSILHTDSPYESPLSNESVWLPASELSLLVPES